MSSVLLLYKHKQYWEIFKSALVYLQYVKTIDALKKWLTLKLNTKNHTVSFFTENINLGSILLRRSIIWALYGYKEPTNFLDKVDVTAT